MRGTVLPTGAGNQGSLPRAVSLVYKGCECEGCECEACQFGV